MAIEGYLIKNGTTGRYEIEGKDRYFTSGSPLEVWNGYEERWVRSRVEHNGKDYYIVDVGHDEYIGGLLVRTVDN